MDIRYGAGPEDAKRYDTAALRKEFLIEKLFVPDEAIYVYSHIDRVIAGGLMPMLGGMPLERGVDCWKTLGTTFFLERRELGVINIGGPGTVTVDGTVYPMERLEALYVGMGAKDVMFSSKSEDNMAKFYVCSTPAHKTYPTVLAAGEKVPVRELGTSEDCNRRTLRQLIHPAVMPTCQLLMGCTSLAEGSVWNTMPSHTHERRMEVYLYFDVKPDQTVFHYMGEPTETRHIAMHNEQAVISPSWSIHSGCGTSNYTFIWAMAGENQAFDDMDNLATADLR